MADRRILDVVQQEELAAPPHARQRGDARRVPLDEALEREPRAPWTQKLTQARIRVVRVEHREDATPGLEEALHQSGVAPVPRLAISEEGRRPRPIRRRTEEHQHVVATDALPRELLEILQMIGLEARRVELFEILEVDQAAKIVPGRDEQDRGIGTCLAIEQDGLLEGPQRKAPRGGDEDREERKECEGREDGASSSRRRR